MLLSLHCLLWGAIATCVIFLSTSPPLTKAFRENWKTLVFIILLALTWRLPFEDHFFYGLEYEDSYIYPVAARYLAFNSLHAAPATSQLLTTVCAVGSWNSCRSPETSSGHFIGYPFMIAVAAKAFGYGLRTASSISLAASLITVVFVFLAGKLLDPNGISGLAGALIFSVTPALAIQGGSTYAEPVSNMLVVACLLICLYLLTCAGGSWSALIVPWLALTFTSLLAIVVKRENVLVVPVLLLVNVAITFGAPRTRPSRIAMLVTSSICAVLAFSQLRLLTVIRREQVEYSVFPFSLGALRTVIPVFLKGYLSWNWYCGTAALVLVAVLISAKSNRRFFYVIVLFASYLLLYSSHVRSYYQLHGGTVTEPETLRYSMNVAGLWSIMAGLGFSTLVLRFARNGLGEESKPWVGRIMWVCLVCSAYGSWIMTDRVKEDAVANESTARLRPAEAALRAIHERGNPDTFIISVEPLVVQMLARNPVNVIDFKDLRASLLQELSNENPNATFFYLEQDIHNSQIDRERYRKSFDALADAHKILLVHGDHYSIFEILYR